MTLPVEGHAEPGLAPVAELFAANFQRDDDYQELGAALCVYLYGRPVLDIWAGYADATRDRPWLADTLVNVWSTTKGAAALCVALLADRGLLDYGQRVADLWPAFAQNGKAGITIGQVMSHQAGLPGWEAATSLDDLYDHDLACARLAAQAPVYAPGTQCSYHAATFGFLAGEIVRRAAGTTLGQLLACEIAGPIGADFHIGLPASEDARVADLLGPRNPPDTAAMDLPLPARMALANPAQDPARAADRAWRAAELPALNGHASARGVARLYGLMAHGGAFEGVRVLSEAGLARMSAIAVDRDDLMLGFNPQWGMGVAHNLIGVYGPDPRVFGHSGWGGSFGCADAEARVSIGYVCNQMGSELVGDPRGAALAHAIYAALK
jgi:CubicO group peptidase (beta-lactamase class C family)